jgi:hypothetical protein
MWETRSWGRLVTGAPYLPVVARCGVVDLVFVLAFALAFVFALSF